MKEPPSGVIFDIQRWSTEDGPGIRTTIFFKGCPLRCAWCCNPESWSPRPQPGFFRDRCRACGACERACPQGLDRLPEVCTACGACVAACPYGARQMFGKRMTAEEILEAVARDRVFHRASGGGVTFSGGEATAQPRLLRYLTERLHRAGAHVALETCGHFDWAENEAALKRMDLVHFDLKHMDDEAHRRLTGAGNGLILANAERLAALGRPMIVRIPLVAGLNDSEENLERTARFVAERLGGAPVEVLPWHGLGTGKAEAIGAASASLRFEAPDPERLASARARFAAPAP